MLLEDVILGLISCAPMSGYDLKKAISHSQLFEWAGGSNQVYKALSELTKAGYVENELIPGVSAPAKKTYRPTEAGLAHLNKSALKLPEPPLLRRPFALQLLFGGGVSRDELAMQLDAYEGEVRGIMAAANVDLLPGITALSPYQKAVLDACATSFAAFYSGELDWIAQLRTKVLPLVANHAQINPAQKLICEVCEVDGIRYVKVSQGQIHKESDALTLVTACVEADINLVLLPAACLSAEFLRLSTRVAGMVLGKLANYRIRTAAVLDPQTTKGALQSFITEANQGNQFHAASDESQAIAWLRKE